MVIGVRCRLRGAGDVTASAPSGVSHNRSWPHAIGENEFAATCDLRNRELIEAWLHAAARIAGIPACTGRQAVYLAVACRPISQRPVPPDVPGPRRCHGLQPSGTTQSQLRGPDRTTGHRGAFSPD